VGSQVSRPEKPGHRNVWDDQAGCCHVRASCRWRGLGDDRGAATISAQASGRPAADLGALPALTIPSRNLIVLRGRGGARAVEARTCPGPSSRSFGALQFRQGGVQDMPWISPRHVTRRPSTVFNRLPDPRYGALRHLVRSGTDLSPGSDVARRRARPLALAFLHDPVARVVFQADLFVPL